jgi:hypothetical protein
LAGLFAVTLASLLGLRQVGDQPPPAKAAEEGRAEKKDEPAADMVAPPLDPLDVLRVGEPEAKRPLADKDLQLEPAEYEFLIATVPDPVDSKFAHEFDAAVEAIQRAFEARDFPLWASRLPWHPDQVRGRVRMA